MEEPRPAEGRTKTLERKRVQFISGGLLTLLVLFLAWKWWPRGPAAPLLEQDPRLTPTTAYRNIGPEVRYVGAKVCAQCHLDKVKTYRRHPMGRSFASVSQTAPLERYDREAHNPFEKLDYQFLVERQGPRMIHKKMRRNPQGQVVTEFTAEVQYAIGSGTRGRTYLINRDGYLFQSPLSWYSQPGVWDLTPGFAILEHFERPAKLECLFCHCNQVDAVPHTLNRYRPPIFHGQAIGCERCHGPGALHVELRRRGDWVEGVDDTIVNPRDLPPALREGVCQQCHLHGESRIVRRDRQLFDYRPGMPLHKILSVFVRSPEVDPDRAVADHTEQMYRSRCFQGSKGQLGCISCHDPHLSPAPEQKTVYYRDRCLSCHQEKACGLSPSVRRARNSDSCVDCHMPRAASKIAHTAGTDHRVRRRPEPNPPPQEAPRRLLPGEIPLVHFHRDLVSPQNEEISRDLGLALIEVGNTYLQLAGRVNLIALPLLEAAVQSSPEDVPAWEAKGFALWQLDRKPEALAAFQAALARAPQRELTLTYLGVLAAALGRRDDAIAYWQRAIAVNPWCSQYHYRLASLFAERQEWQKALEEDETAIELNPFVEEMRLVLIACLVRTGKEDRARTEFDKLVAIRPGDREKLLCWYQELKIKN